MVTYNKSILTAFPLTARISDTFIWHKVLKACIRVLPDGESSSCLSPLIISVVQTEILSMKYTGNKLSKIKFQ